MREQISITSAMSALFREADGVREELNKLLPDVTAARRKYCASRSAADLHEMEEFEERARGLCARYGDIVTEMQNVSGIPEEVFEQLDKLENEQNAGDSETRIQRAELTKENVATTDEIDDLLANSVEALRQMVDVAWLREFPRSPQRLNPENSERPVSLVRGLRPESEFPSIHRFAQALFVAQDYLEGEQGYDHFAGALLVPQVASLGSKLELVHAVGGEVETRIRSLWRRPGQETDSTIFELLVAAGCIARGRNVEFLTPGKERTPDLRCHDPFPLLIECKRKRSLSDYELYEERKMRELFERLDRVARERGIWGCFDLELTIQSDEVDQDEIVGCLIRQRLPAHPDRPLQYPWGSVAYRELPSRFGLPQTRMYSPNMMRFAFGWDSDLPGWDGIIFRVGSSHELVVDEIREPVALLWTNTSGTAVTRRAWGPTDVFGDATSQIPAGEFGMIYVAYQEGTREQIADLRTQNFIERIRNWYHPASIRIPLSVLVRLYPRPLNDGQPDMIENAMYLLSEEYGEPALASDFPAAVFTMHGKR